MTIGAGLALVALAAFVGWRLWLLHRAVEALQVQLAGIPTRFDGELDQLWKDVEGLRGTDARQPRRASGGPSCCRPGRP